VLVLTISVGQQFLIPGPRNPGHEDLECDYCHQRSPGTFRQQIQANIRYLIGLRPEVADFGRQDVTNKVCLACHERANDRHPVYRFFEPRFKKARQEIQPQLCISCHLEHTGKRVSKKEITFCKSCHKKTEINKDPLTIPHRQLIQDEQWTSCLGCHDFHGNHRMKTENLLKKRFTVERIRSYFQGGPSPYSDKKHHRAKKKPE